MRKHNVQFAAIILRTADLLHITLDRTPSVAFRLIDPTDPVSQREWAKQASVRRVRSQKGKNEEGVVTDTAPRDTIEVFAEFAHADGFFGLTSYLRYADQQLKQSYDWARTSRTELGVKHEFPWRQIDDAGVTATGFSPHQLSFTLDQAKILDLLTGHTLYNDTSIVIRELLQNAIDAVRLQALIDNVAPESMTVAVEWHSETRDLIVRDCGTGMTQAVIENNLLKAGASRYQEEEFQKKHAAFSPISRFGIGVLSAFMIADSVEIVTCTPEEYAARSLTLKSVHGRYLVELLEKETDERALRVGEHGTEIRLRVRASADLPDVLETLRSWIVIPRCQVRATIDGHDVGVIGFRSPAEAIVASLEANGIEPYKGGEPADSAIQVVEKTVGAVDTAFAVRWNQWFREWEFLTLDVLGESGSLPAVGACIEGIRVERQPAGYTEAGVVALSNASGHGAPKTNVARSGIEATPERTTMLRAIYGSYLQHVADEAEALGGARGLSLTWAAQEAELLLRPLLEAEYGGQRTPTTATEPAVLTTAVRAARIVLAEGDGSRRLATASELREEDGLWTVDSGFVRAAQRMLREIPGAASLGQLAVGFEMSAFHLPEGTTLIGYEAGSPLYNTALEGWEVTKMVIHRDQRRVDLRWQPEQETPAWLVTLPPWLQVPRLG